MSRAIYSAIALMIASVVSIAALVGCGGATGGTSEGDSLLGRRISIVDAALLGDSPDSAASLSTLAPNGERILLNFWASWCLPCRDEIPLIAAYAPTAEGVVVVGVLYRDEAGPAAVAAAELGASWPTLLDPSGAIAAQVPVNAAPITLLLDGAGVVRDYRVGPFASVDEIREFAEAP